MKRLILFGLLGGMLAASSGCGLCQSIFYYRPCAGCRDCAGGGCGDCCDEGCGPACGCDARFGRSPVHLAVRGPVAIATRAAKRTVAQPVAHRAADAAIPVAIPAVIRVATRAATGVANVAGIGDLSVASSPCSRPVAGVDRDAASDIGVISTATRQIAGTPAIATATTRAADAIRAAASAAIAAAAMSTRATSAT